eukprot:249301_1
MCFHGSIVVVGFLVASTFCICGAQIQTVPVNGSYPYTLPRWDDGMAAGYDKNTDTVFILGGNRYQYQLTTFNGSTFIDQGLNVITEEIWGYGQYYSQLGDILWMINRAGMGFISFNVHTMSQVAITDTVIPYPHGFGKCLATMQELNHQYLFVLGGDVGGRGTTTAQDSVYMFNISSNNWTEISPMNTARHRLACIVHGQKLYAVGGYPGNSATLYLKTIETLKVSNLFNLATETWSYFNQQLNKGLLGHRVIGYGQFLYVLGGYCGEDYPEGFPTSVNVIDTITGTVTIGGSLAHGREYIAVIAVDHVIYGFGGYSYGGWTNEYQYFELSTISPTMAPSVSPTDAPSTQTISPSSTPSNAPTNIPTLEPTTQTPTSNPTIKPSNDPTQIPTKSTLNPSQNPTKYPTETPSDGPSISPTERPTMEPSENPTLIPTVNPTNIPTASPTLQPSFSAAITSTQLFAFNTTIATSNTSTMTLMPSMQHKITSSLTQTEGQNAEEDKALSISTSLLVIIFFLSVFSIVAFIVSILWISMSTRHRTMSGANAKWREAFNAFGLMEYFGIVLETFDIITDYLFAANIIISDDSSSYELFLGWFSLLFAILGVIIFVVKYLTMRKLMGKQIATFKHQLTLTENLQKRKEIIEKIRLRLLDIDVLSILNGCIEDIPQTIIILIFLTNFGFDYISIFTISLSVFGLCMRLVGVFLTICGCKDPTDGDPNDESVNVKIQMMNKNLGHLLRN